MADSRQHKMGEPMAAEERARQAIEANYPPVHERRTWQDAEIDAGTIRMAVVIRAAESAARDDERAEWARQLNVAGPIPHRLSIFRQELFTEFARALRVEATRKCSTCNGITPEYCSGACRGAGYVNLSLDEIVDAGLAPLLKCVESLKALLAIHSGECTKGDGCGAVVEARERLGALPLRGSK